MDKKQTSEELIIVHNEYAHQTEQNKTCFVEFIDFNGAVTGLER